MNIYVFLLLIAVCCGSRLPGMIPLLLRHYVVIENPEMTLEFFEKRYASYRSKLDSLTAANTPIGEIQLIIGPYMEFVAEPYKSIRWTSNPFNMPFQISSIARVTIECDYILSTIGFTLGEPIQLTGNLSNDIQLTMDREIRIAASYNLRHIRNYKYVLTWLDATRNLVYYMHSIIGLAYRTQYEFEPRDFASWLARLEFMGTVLKQKSDNIMAKLSRIEFGESNGQSLMIRVEKPNRLGVDLNFITNAYAHYPIGSIIDSSGLVPPADQLPVTISYTKYKSPLLPAIRSENYGLPEPITLITDFASLDDQMDNILWVNSVSKTLANTQLVLAIHKAKQSQIYNEMSDEFMRNWKELLCSIVKVPLADQLKSRSLCSTIVSIVNKSYYSHVLKLHHDCLFEYPNGKLPSRIPFCNDKL